MTDQTTRRRKPVADRSCTGETGMGGPCYGMLTIDHDWKPPDGFDPRMYRFVCDRNPAHVYFLVIGPKELENLKPKTAPEALPGL